MVVLIMLFGLIMLDGYIDLLGNIIKRRNKMRLFLFENVYIRDFVVWIFFVNL